MLSPIDYVKAVVDCDNRCDGAGYRKLIHDDYVSFVHGKESTVGAEAEVEALARWWKAARDVHLEPHAGRERRLDARYTLEGERWRLFGARRRQAFQVESRCSRSRQPRPPRLSLFDMGLMGQLGMLPGDRSMKPIHRRPLDLILAVFSISVLYGFLFSSPELGVPVSAEARGRRCARSTSGPWRRSRPTSIRRPT
jgi:hypothetical protein